MKPRWCDLTCKLTSLHKSQPTKVQSCMSRKVLTKPKMLWDEGKILLTNMNGREGTNLTVPEIEFIFPKFYSFSIFSISSICEQEWFAKTELLNLFKQVNWAKLAPHCDFSLKYTVSVSEGTDFGQKKNLNQRVYRFMV